MFPNRGKGLQASGCPSAVLYASAIASALRTELGQTHQATKTIMKWTGVSDRTAKNWLSGAYGPSGNHLIQLACESDAILNTLLVMAGRQQYLIGADLLAIREALIQATSRIEAVIAASAAG